MNITIEINERERRLIENALVKYGENKSEIVKRDILCLLANLGKQIAEQK